MLVKATEEILIHLGYNAKRLKQMIDSNLHLGKPLVRPVRLEKL